MVTDQELANGVASVLRQSDPNGVASVNGVVKQLEAKLGLDLSTKTSFIRDQIDLILRSSNPPKDHFALPHFQNPPFPHHDLPFPYSPPPLQQQQQQQQQQAISAPSAPPPLPKESTQTGGKRRGGPGGLSKVCGVSPELQTIVGEPALPRTEIVKQLWAYIRKNNLQDPSNKRKIICNDALRLVFETDCTDMFKMNKLLAKHIIPLEPSGGARNFSLEDLAPDSKRLKTASVESATKCTESSPSSSPVIISDALAKFFGTGEREMLQSEAVHRVWEYVKVNHLEDPLNSMVILCDARLQELFGCESFSVLGIQQMLVRHFYLQS